MGEQDGGCEGQMPQPTEHHQHLTRAVGRWKVASKFWMGGPEAPPMESTATEEVEAIGPFWTVSRFEGEMFGAPFVGRSIVGYDPWKEQYLSTWIDSMSPAFFYMRGTREGDVITMEGEGVDPGTGQPAHYKTVEHLVGQDERRFKMFLKMPDGSDCQLFEMIYKRAD